MRDIYIDEAGVTAKEPVSVVAAVIVRSDGDWMVLRDGLEELKAQYIPTPHHDGFIFHSTDIFHGKGAVRPFQWSPRYRMKLLCELLGLLRRVNVVVTVAFVRRDRERNYASNTKAVVVMDHLLAWAYCISAADRYVVATCKNENARIIAENHPEMRKKLSTIFRNLRDDRDCDVRHLIGVERIIDVPHFQEKDEAPLLQIADVVAFAFQRFLSGRSGSRQLMRAATGFLNPINRHVPVGHFYFESNRNLVEAGDGQFPIVNLAVELGPAL